MTTLPPTGCLPAAITLFSSGSNQCVARLNQDAINFNSKLNITSQVLQDKLPGLKLVVFDIYQPLLNLITKPTDNGKVPTSLQKVVLCISNPHLLIRINIFWISMKVSTL